MWPTNDDRNRNAHVQVRNQNNSYYYNRRFWAAPKKFIFPKNALLKHTWHSCLKGFPNHEETENGESIIKPIAPLCCMSPIMILKKLSDYFRRCIIPIMKLIESYPLIRFLSDSELTEEFLNISFDFRVDHVKNIVSYIYLNEKWRGWKTLCFCKMISFNEVMKRGTVEDKERENNKKSHKNNKRKKWS